MSNPDVVGMLTDLQFAEVIQQCLGLSSPIQSPSVAQFVGSLGNCAIKVDKHGVALTNAKLPGCGWNHCHNRIQALLLNMANLRCSGC